MTTSLTQLICDRIDQEGPIPFAEYMQLALYHPMLGYYQNGQHVFGKEGDFVTAPLISPLFSQCLAERCQKTLSKLNDASILELGAGNGQMAYDILLELNRLNSLPKQYLILEPSAYLQHRQKHTLSQLPSHLLERVAWKNSLPDDNSFTGIILANEVIDAMPVHGFRFADNTTEELFITHAQGKLSRVYQDCTNERLLDAVTQLSLDANTCYESEVNLWVEPWLRSLYACLNQGDVLLIDYGFLEKEYYHPDRARGTLRCFYQHKRVDDYLQRPGEQDITADVNFSHLGNSALDIGFSIQRYQTQTYFLIDQHITDKLAAITNKTDYDAAARAVKQLTLPQEMGERFKVMDLMK